MRNRINYIGFFLLVILLSGMYSCNTSPVEPDDAFAGYDYYPLKTGRYVIYEVRDTFNDGSDETDTLYYIKEILEEKINFDDEVWYKAERYYKASLSDPWPAQPDSVWSVSNTGTQLVRKEDDQDYVKIIFPVQNNKQWNGNVRNTFSSETYTMKKTGEPFDNDFDVYENTLTVHNSNIDNLFLEDIRYEVFASGVGMVYKDNLKAEYESQGASIGQLLYRKHIVLKAIEHGLE